MVKVFKAGDIVQFAVKDVSSMNPDGFVVLGTTESQIHYDYYKLYPFVMVGLNTGKSYSIEDPQTQLNHCQRIKGKVINIDKEFPKRVMGCTSMSPKIPSGYYKGETWICEREPGHEGDHMAWYSYPHSFLPYGVWTTSEESGKDSEIKTEESVGDGVEESPF